MLKQIIETNTGNDLTPFIMAGEMEKRVGKFYDNLSKVEKNELLQIEEQLYLSYKFENLPKFLKTIIINKLT